MASSSSERGSSSRSTNAPLMPGRVVIACDATKHLHRNEFKHIINSIQMRNGMVEEGDTITVLGVLHKVLHPMGFQMQIGPDSFIGTQVRKIKQEVSRIVDEYVGMLQHSAEECERNGVIIEARIVVGAPLKMVVAQEAVASNATWLVLTRHLTKEIRFYLKHIPCRVALIHDNFSLEVLRPYCSDKVTHSSIDHKLFYSLSKIVPLLPVEGSGNNEQQYLISPSCRGSMSSPESFDSEKSSFGSSITSKSVDQIIFSPDEFGSNHHFQLQKLDKTNAKVERESDDSCQIMPNQRSLNVDSDLPCLSDEVKMSLDLKGCSYSEIEIATNDFSTENLLGEGEYGVVYKGQLKNGQLIAVKLQKEADIQGLFTEFQSELCVLMLACHKNIVMLLGCCRRENLNILVYEYVCNKSLEWHLFDNTECVLEWHRRYAVAIGIAKGLRFLHEECRGCPIIHRDLRPSNIYLTHEFVPLLADCGLAKWKTNKYDKQTKLVGSLEYLAPEYAENGVYSVKTDIFAFGIVLIQLISGRKANPVRDNDHYSLRQWAVPLIQRLALDELVDPRLGDSYSTYQLYQMAKVAYSCVHTKPATRPTIGEASRILDGGNDNLHHLINEAI